LKTPEVVELDPREAHAHSCAGAVLLDVRAAEEFDDGHPAAAINVPLAIFVEGRLVDREDFVEHARAALPASSSARVLILCRSGVRARRAAHALLGAGYTGVVVVRGGFDGTRGPFGEVVEPGWKRLGLP
jgi:rhodanese-related sulfurtransferase